MKNPTKVQATPIAPRRALKRRWGMSLMVMVTLTTPPASSFAQSRSSERSEARCVVCIPATYKELCERGLATAKEKGRELTKCEGANEQLGLDRQRDQEKHRRERSEWERVERTMIEGMREGEAARSRVTAERDEAKRMIWVVGGAAFVAGVVAGVVAALQVMGG